MGKPIYCFARIVGSLGACLHHRRHKLQVLALASTIICISLWGSASSAQIRENQVTAIRIAVAANFAKPLEHLLSQFSQSHKVSVVQGSTGKLFAQIVNGAPFDLFLAADASRPQRLQTMGLAKAPVNTYAQGRLVLWIPKSGQNRLGVTHIPEPSTCVGVGLLENFNLQRISMANPLTAPYGTAAQQVLDNTQWLQKGRKTAIVNGESVAQAYHYVAKGLVDAGFIAKSQWQSQDLPGESCLVPEHLHDAIEQKMVLLSDAPLARELYEYLLTPAIRKRIAELGYGA